MRVVVRPPQPGTYPPATTLTFAGANAIAIAAIMGAAPGSTIFNVTDLLQIWLLKAKAVAPPHGTPADLVTATAAIKNRIPDIYKAAAVPLIQGMGAFCSYCGTVLPGLAEVEHCVPKAPYPTYAVTWTNFLVACSPCNNFKSDNPSRAVALPWTGKPNPTEAEFYSAIRTAHYLWPDLDRGAFNDMQIGLQYFNTVTASWTDLAKAVSMNTDNFMLSQNIATREVMARINFVGGAQNVSVRAVVLNGSAHATDMTGLCGLNDCKTPDSTYDRRVFNRTIAWFTTLTAIRHYRASIGTPQQPTFAMIIKMLAVGTGFYEVWLNLLAETLSFPQAKAFATDLNVQGQYPGSNVNDMFP